MNAANAVNNNLRWDVLTITLPGFIRDLPAFGARRTAPKNGHRGDPTDEMVVDAQRRLLKMRKMPFAAILALAAFSVGSAAASAYKDPLDAATLNTMRSQFGKLEFNASTS
jgi:hypothetical protein